jgi:hypothetical protein
VSIGKAAEPPISSSASHSRSADAPPGLDSPCRLPIYRSRHAPVPSILPPFYAFVDHTFMVSRMTLLARSLLPYVPHFTLHHFGAVSLEFRVFHILICIIKLDICIDFIVEMPGLSDASALRAGDIAISRSFLWREMLRNYHSAKIIKYLLIAGSDSLCLSLYRHFLT